MSQSNIISDSEFLKFLRYEDLKNEYKKESTKIQKTIKADFEDTVAYTGLYKQHDNEIRTDKKHRNVINASIYPFAHKGKLTEIGYYFIRTEPLLEKNAPDVDFVIESPEKRIALFGEAKSSSQNPSTILREMKKRKKSIIENKQHLQETLIPHAINFEYVISTEAIEARDLYAAIIRSDDKNILWEYGGNEENLLSVFALPDDISKNKDKVLHSDQILNKNLIRVKTSTKFKIFFPKSHPVARLSILTWIDRDINNLEAEIKESFSFKDVLKIFARELECFHQDYVNKMAKRTLELALKIGFIKQQDNENYKIATKSNDPKAREQDLKDKWIDYIIKKEAKQKHDKLKLKLQNNMRIKHNDMFPALDDFSKQ